MGIEIKIRLKSIDQLKDEFDHYYDSRGNLHFKEFAHFITKGMVKVFGKEVTISNNYNGKPFGHYSAYVIKESYGGFEMEWFNEFNDMFGEEDFEI